MRQPPTRRREPNEKSDETFRERRRGSLLALLDKLEGEQTTAACGQLDSFISQVNAYIGNGTLTAAQGQALVDATNTLKSNLGC